jgi:hypothetical protein
MESHVGTNVNMFAESCAGVQQGLTSMSDQVSPRRSFLAKTSAGAEARSIVSTYSGSFFIATGIISRYLV